MGDSLFSSTQKRAARMAQIVDENAIISDRAYNLIMGLVVLYGLVVNYILCATIGVQIFYSINPIIFIIGYIVFAIAGSWIAAVSDRVLISFLGYNMVVLPLGILVSFVVYCYGGVSSTIVGEAFYYTMLITAIMICLSMLFPGFFSRIGGFLFAALIGIMICGIVMSFVGGYGGLYSYGCAAIFALYIGYDFYRSQQFPKTADNAVDCALDIYLDIINLFLRLLEIVARSQGGGRSGGRASN